MPQSFDLKWLTTIVNVLAAAVRSNVWINGGRLKTGSLEVSAAPTGVTAAGL